MTSERPVRIAVDAMGGDYAPSEVVKGAVEAARKGGVEILLVGDQAPVEEELKRIGGPALPIVPSEGKITEEEHPALAFRQKPRASVIVATGLVKAGRADAIVTIGSTGAAMAAATIILGLFEGLERPALGGPFLGLAPGTVVLDLGSNVDCRPSQLVSFAVLGSVFARFYLGTENPRVALLSVGAEEAKGNRQVREAIPLFRESGLNFVGNVEGMDLFTGRADVIVCDGFVGNVLVKFAEGLGAAMAGYIRKSLAGRLPDREVEELASSVWGLTNIARKTGGPLFGVNGLVVVGHGASRAEGVAGAIETARRCVELRLVEALRDELARVRERVKL